MSGIKLTQLILYAEQSEILVSIIKTHIDLHNHELNILTEETNEIKLIKEYLNNRINILESILELF